MDTTTLPDWHYVQRILRPIDHRPPDYRHTCLFSKELKSRIARGEFSLTPANQLIIPPGQSLISFLWDES